uniref:Microfibril associated protein 2 n=1 Tax=Seriola dumerili TaxID=41447 RepID=A0A3B4U1N9_SERDU
MIFKIALYCVSDSFLNLFSTCVSGSELETEPTEPGPLDCREEQYPCTRLYSVHKPCKQCLNSLCFYRYVSLGLLNDLRTDRSPPS